VDLTGIALVVIVVLGVFFMSRKKGPATPYQPTPDTPSTPDPTPPENLAPEVFPPLLSGPLDWRSQFIIDLRHRLHGCDGSGAALEETGAFDPDGDLLRYWIEVTGPDKKGKDMQYAVFSRDGLRIDRRWLPTSFFPVVRKNRFDVTDPTTEQEAVVFCYVGLSENTPPGGGLMTPMACTPVPVPTPTPKVLGEMTVMYQVRDPAGRTRSAASRAKVTVGSC